MDPNVCRSSKRCNLFIKNGKKLNSYRNYGNYQFNIRMTIFSAQNVHTVVMMKLKL